MGRFVPVFARVIIGLPVMRLMNFWPVCLLLVLVRRYVVPCFGPARMLVIRMLRRTRVAVIIARVVPLLMLGTVVTFVSASVIVVIVPMLCVGWSTCT